MGQDKNFSFTENQGVILDFLQRAKGDPKIENAALELQSFLVAQVGRETRKEVGDVLQPPVLSDAERAHKERKDLCKVCFSGLQQYLTKAVVRGREALGGVRHAVKYFKERFPEFNGAPSTDHTHYFEKEFRAHDGSWYVGMTDRTLPYTILFHSEE